MTKPDQERPVTSTACIICLAVVIAFLAAIGAFGGIIAQGLNP